MIKELPVIQPAMIVNSYQDGLARFGFASGRDRLLIFGQFLLY